MSSLSDYQKNNIQARIKKKSPFCNVKDYKKINITSDVTKISFGVTYNTLGHALFGALSFGVASLIAKSSKTHVYYFDTSTGDLLGSTQSEAETFFNNKINTCIDNFDLTRAEKYLSKLCGLSNSKDNRLKYDVIKKLNVVKKSINEDQIQDINFETINDSLKSLPNKFKTMVEKLKIDVEIYSNNKINTCIDNFDLTAAENYLSKLCSLSDSKDNRLKYDVIKKLNVIMNNLEEGEIQDAITDLETINEDFNALPNKFKIIIEKLKIEMDKFNSTNTSFEINIPEHTHETDFGIDWEFTTQTRII